MPLHDTGDIVKAVGFVTIYGAYLEDRIAELIDICGSTVNLRHNIQKLTAADQAKHLLSGLNIAYMKAPDYDVKEQEKGIVNYILEAVKEHMQERHVVVHSTLNAQSDGEKIIRKNRRLQTEEEVNSAEIFDLANDLYELQSKIDGLKFAVGRLIDSLQSSAYL